MWNVDPFNLLIHWIALTAIFLLMTYLFRDQVTLEGFFGYFFLLSLIVPCNVLGGAIVIITRISEERPMISAVTQIAANIVMLFLWCRLLPGLTFSGLISLFLFGLLFGLLAFALHLIPPIPFEQIFPHRVFENSYPAL